MSKMSIRLTNLKERWDNLDEISLIFLLVYETVLLRKIPPIKTKSMGKHVLVVTGVTK